MADRIAIDDVTPVVSCGRYPAKAVAGEHFPVSATVWREGHDAVAATVVWRGPGDRAARHTRMTEIGPEDPDRFTAVLVPDTEGPWTYRVDAWSDPWHTWLHAVEVKIAAGQGAEDLDNDLENGARLLDRVSRRPDRRLDRALLGGAAAALRDADQSLPERVGPALSPEVRRIMHDFPARDLVTKGPSRKLQVDRERAAFGSWYEFFPRSTGEHGEHGTFATAAKALDRVASMGFDVVYLPPIHPIGHENRKGPNNTLQASPDDVGSPWAIGSSEGGHDAIHPDLGTLADFDAFVGRARELGMEVALDLALQCAPDHPWVLKHPEWFTTRPDGTIAYAENPPKKYQDIYPLNFDNDPEGLYEEVLRVVLHWVEHGVRIFRVDNPHTKPPDFWHWLIKSVRRTHPDVLFLAEAFTRPARLWGLAKLGFTQSYTYFTWRTSKQELIDFGVDLVEHWHVGRPNLFVNTPDILHESLQQRRSRNVRAACRARRHALADLGRLLRLRALRAPGGAAGQRGVPGLGEVPAAPARLRGRAGAGTVAGAVARQAQRDPPRTPRVAADAHAALPPRRQRRPAGLQQAGSRHRRHRGRGGHPGSVRQPGRHAVAGPARPGHAVARPGHRPRRGHRRDLGLGPDQLRAARTVAGRGAHRFPAPMIRRNRTACEVNADARRGAVRRDAA